MFTSTLKEKLNMRLLKVMIISLLLCGCDAAKLDKEFFPTPQESAQKINYVKDNRTGLCFVYNPVNNGHGFTQDVYTNVPCTPEVEGLLVK